MPALNPVELKRRADRVAEYYLQPDKLIKETRSYLEQYREVIKRSSDSVLITLNAYHVKSPVVKELVSSLYVVLRKQGADVKGIIDAFWNEPIYEFKIISLKLIEKLSYEDQNAAWQYLKTLSIESPDDAVLDYLAKTYVTIAENDQEEKLWSLVDEWATAGDEERNKLALKLIELTTNSKAELDVPHALGLIRRIWKRNAMVLTPYIKKALLALLILYPRDTIYFLQLTFNISEYGSMRTIVRQLLENINDERLTNEIKRILRKI